MNEATEGRIVGCRPSVSSGPPESYAMAPRRAFYGADHVRVPERGQNAFWGVWGPGMGKVNLAVENAGPSQKTKQIEKIKEEVANPRVMQAGHFKPKPRCGLDLHRSLRYRNF